MLTIIYFLIMSWIKYFTGAEVDMNLVQALAATDVFMLLYLIVRR